MILAIGNSSAYETETFQAVRLALHKHGEDALLFRQDKCLTGERLSFGITRGKCEYRVVVDGKIHQVDSFLAIWLMKPHLPRELLEYKPVEHRDFIHRQFRQMRQTLCTAFRNKRWINDPWATQIAEDKMHQLHVASEIGLAVPDTVISSDPDEVRNFYRSHGGNIVVKLLATSPVLDHVIYTNPVTPERMEHIELVRYSPSIFQARVDKAYELRITVVGDKLFAAKILSQEDKATAIDWRRKPEHADQPVRMETTRLSASIGKQIHQLMATLDLRFGCIDMIVTPEGQEIFLEINPNGQWYFAQLRTGDTIAEAIAELLVG